VANTTGFKARVEYEVTDGTQTTYTFPFSYLRKQFVMVSILHSDATETALEYGVDYTVNDLSVSLTTPAQVGEHIIIYRQTSTDKIVTWNDGSILLARDMNTEDAQMLHLQEEQQDYITANAISTKVTSDKEVLWDALNHRVVNVSDPKDPQDVVTKHYMENVQGGFVADNTKILNDTKATLSATQQTQSKAQTNETLSKAWATSTESPDNAEDTQSSTGKTQSSRSWALYGIGKAQEAATSEAHAKASETNAKSSETNAKTSETNAKTSETNAKASETKALTSEQNAKASETKALTSEQNAKTSETNAKTSETNAKTSETNAKASETKALTSETNAKTSETHAKDSETKALTSEQNAKTSETNAKTSETNASSSETKALESEQNAKVSETNAKTSETNAKTSETNAKTSETNAKASETNAKTSETNAANSAKQAAESAGVFQDFKGATANTDGNGGKVPKPLAGQQNKVLKADGTWGDGVTPKTLLEGIQYYPFNYVPPDLSNSGWIKLGLCSIFYGGKDIINNQPTWYGQLINIPIKGYDEIAQLWVSQSEGRIFSRGGNLSKSIDNTPFEAYATVDDVKQNTASMMSSIINADGHLVFPNGAELWVD
jgi:uncharacterized coiled-coil DUF342 family protein